MSIKAPGTWRRTAVAAHVAAEALSGSGKSQLMPGVQTVPDGIYELVSKQQQHSGYIKVTH
jgi:intracellular sulfur oxidation DsrE/DsrF family protein